MCVGGEAGGGWMGWGGDWKPLREAVQKQRNLFMGFLNVQLCPPPHTSTQLWILFLNVSWEQKEGLNFLTCEIIKMMIL